MSTQRIAVVGGAAERVIPYLPANYEVVGTFDDPTDERIYTLIAGFDVAGWTLDDYVIPRLASGLHPAYELVRKEQA